MRWAIVSELRRETRSAQLLADTVAVSPTLLSHHLKVLREAGLITRERRGRWIDYSVDGEALTGLALTLKNGHLNRHR